MSARARAALRRFWLDLGPALGSTRLSVVLMVTAALYYLLLAIWSGSSRPEVVRGIARLSPFWLVYALLLVNTAVCFWNRLPLLGRELARRRFGQLGSFLFHGSFLLVAGGFLATVAWREEARIWLATGEEFEGRDEQFLSRTAMLPTEGRTEDLRFRLESIEPRYWADRLLFTELAADLRFPDGAVRRSRINRPVWLGAATFVRLAGYGWAPRFELSGTNGLRIDSAVVKLNLFPPGQRDYFVLPRFPHRIYLELYPDWAPEQGKPATRSMNLDRPAVVTEVYRGRLKLAQGPLLADDRLEFEGLRLGFPEIVPWGEFSIVRDPGAPWIFAGYLLALLGLVLKLAPALAARRAAGNEGAE